MKGRNVMVSFGYCDAARWKHARGAMEEAGVSARIDPVTGARMWPIRQAESVTRHFFVEYTPGQQWGPALFTLLATALSAMCDASAECGIEQDTTLHVTTVMQLCSSLFTSLDKILAAGAEICAICGAVTTDREDIAISMHNGGADSPLTTYLRKGMRKHGEGESDDQ